MTQAAETKQLDGVQSILVVDDHPLYCDALVTTLNRIFSPEYIETAQCLVDALAIDFKPDLVMLDLKLPDVQGLSGFIQMRDRMPDVPIVVISSEVSDKLITNIVALGGTGFISKDASKSDLKDALELVGQGEKCFPAGFRKLSRPIQPDPNVVDLARRLAELTPQQTRILHLICDGKPNKQIAYELSLAEATVKAHVTALLRRLGVRNRTQAALLVQGLSFDNPPGRKDIQSVLS